MPIDKAIIDYYVSILQQCSLVSAESIRRRLVLLTCNDNSLMPLTAKILRRPKLVEKMKNSFDPALAHMVCFVSSNLQRELACRLEVPLFSNDPSLAYWGTKIGSRLSFQQAKIKFPNGTPLFYSTEQLLPAIASLFKQNNCQTKRVVLKLNVGFSGQGNAILTTKNFDPDNLEASIKESLTKDLQYGYQAQVWDTFQAKMKMYGVLAQDWVEDAYGSPSCQALINPKGEVQLLSSHQQLLNGMVFQGCVFPCQQRYRRLLMESTYKIGEVLASKGCRERFAVDFVVRQNEGVWEAHAIEINLRWGGTSHPAIVTKYLTSSELTREGLMLACDDSFKYYVATDTVKNKIYTGLSAEDFLEFVNSRRELQFDSESLTGVVFHLLSAISIYGKFGFVAIEDSPEKAMKLYESTLEILEKEATEISQYKQFTELDLSIKPPDNQENQ